MRSNETIVILQALKALHVELDGVRAEVREVRQCLLKIEEEGLTLNLPVPGSEDGSDPEDEVTMV